MNGSMHLSYRSIPNDHPKQGQVTGLQFCKSARNSIKPQQSLITAVNTLESICSRLERTIDNQNQRLKNIENCLADTLTSRFDKLIDYSAVMSENIRKMVEVSTREEKQRREQMNGFKGERETSVLSSQISQGNGIVTAQIRPVQNSKTNLGHHQSHLTFSPKKLPLRKASKVGHTQKEQGILDVVIPASMGLVRKQSKVAVNDSRFKTMIGKFTSQMCETMYQSYASHKIDLKQLKARFSWQVLQWAINYSRIMKFQATSLQQIFQTYSTPERIRQKDDTLRTILQFLISKYPQSKHKVIDTQLAHYVQDIKQTDYNAYDMLKATNYSFVDNTGKKDFTREIKVWINRLVGETKRVFPIFKQKMKEIFMGEENSIDGEVEVQYEIGSKISDTVEMYTEKELDMPGLNVKSPAITRIIVKWIEELKAMFFNSQEKVLANKHGFKPISGGINVVLPARKKEQLMDVLKNITEQKVKPYKEKKLNHMHMFLNELLMLVLQGYEGYEQLIEDQVVISKVAQYLNSCNEAYLLVILNAQLRFMNSFRKSYSPEEHEANIDLISFSVLDLLRCKGIGSKKQIKRVYDSLKSSQFVEIIRVKNKLNQSTRDILINFRIKGSFLIGQMQLALGDSKDQVNDHFCHFLYEVQRSMLPCLFQIAAQITTCDTRVNYFNKKHPIQFRPSTVFQQLRKFINYNDGKITCSIFHTQTQMMFLKNNVPYCCCYCSKQIQAFTFFIEYLRCPKCHVSICPKCAMMTFPQIEPVVLKRYVNCKKYQPFYPQNARFYTNFGSMSMIRPKIAEALQLSPYVLVWTFDMQSPKGLAYKKYKDTFIPAFRSLKTSWGIPPIDSENNWNAIMITYPPERLKLSKIKCYQKWVIGEMPGFEAERRLEEAGIEDVIGVVKKETKQILILDVVESLSEIDSIMDYKKLEKHLQQQERKVEANIEITSKCLTNLQIISGFKNVDRVRSLNFWENKLTTQSMDSLLRFKNIIQLQLRDNNIDQLQVFKPFRKLQLLNLQNNKLSGKLPQLHFPDLYYLGLSGNMLTDVSSLGHTTSKKLKFLFLINNLLPELPVMDLPELYLIYFMKNKITSLTNLSRSNLPELRRLQGSHNQIQGVLPIMKFPQLELLNLDYNRIQDVGCLGISELPILVEMNLSNNNISKDLPVLRMAKLQKILLNNNNIPNIRPLEMWQLPRITLINLSNNDIINQIPNLNLPSLRQLQLGNNSISCIHKLSSSSLGSLQRLILCSNKITTLPALKIPFVRQLDLSSNLISDILSQNSSQMYRLQVLDLSNNRITSAVPVLNMPCLSELLLDNNEIPELRLLGQRQMIPMIRFVSIRGCRLLRVRYGEKDVVEIDTGNRDHYASKLSKEYQSVKEAKYSRIAQTVTL